MIGDPEVLILDEPTAGLDPKQILEIRELISGLGKDHTIILSSHILPEVSAICKRVLIMNQGLIVADDSPENLAKRILGGSSILLRVDGSIEAIKNALSGIPAIQSLEFRESPEPGTCELVVASSREDLSSKEDTASEDSSSAETDIRRVISHALSKASLPILLMQSQNMSLEEIFLNLTTKEE
jgi:ABC-2 type transport system ATP-binding protein